MMNLKYLLILRLAYCMDTGSTGTFEIDEEEWLYINKDLMEGKSSLYDTTVFQQYMSGGQEACWENRDIYRSGNLTEFVENVMVETARGTDDTCLIKSQKVLTFIEAPKEPLQVDLDIIRWSVLEGRQLSIVLGICKNLNLGCAEKLWKPTALIDQIKVKLYKGKSVVDHPDKDENEKMDLKTLAVTLGDGTITDEIDLAGKSLEGAKMDKIANYLISVFTDIQKKYLQDASPFLDVIDKTVVEAMIRKLRQASECFALLRTLAPLPGGYDLFEDAMIDKIRQMDINDDVLMMVQITDHAATLSIKKTGPRMVEILLFNSGFGLENHSTVELGSRIKHFPARRYVDIPLGILKSLGVIKKVAELSAIVSKFAPAIDKRQESNYTPDDLYQCALSPLNGYAYQFTAEDVMKFRVIPAQRSGTCADKCYWAYFAFTLGESFRPLKLLTSKEGIERATAVDWNGQDTPVARRLIKFAIENYARSVLRYRKRELKGKKLDIKLFGGRKFWRIYESVRHQMGVSKPRHFSGRHFSTIKWPRHLSGLDASVNMLYFRKFEKMPKKIEIESGEKEEQYRIPASAPKDRDEFISQIDTILNLINSHVWNLAFSTEKLVLITSYVIETLPIPSHNVDLWNSVFLGDMTDEPVLKKLFQLLMNLLNLNKYENHIYPSVYVSILKILSIFHKAMIIVDPSFSRCKLLEHVDLDGSSESNYNDQLYKLNVLDRWEGMFNSQHKFIDMTVMGVYEELIYFIKKEETDKFFCDMFQEMGAIAPIRKYLSRYVDAVQWDTLKDVTADTFDDKIKNLYGQRLDDSILPHHYFWRDALNYFRTVSEFKELPLERGIDLNHDPYTGCTVTDSYLECKSSMSTPCNCGVVFPTTKLSYQPSMFSGLSGVSVPPFKELTNEFSEYAAKIKNNLDFCDKDMPLYLNNSFGVTGCFDRLSTLLMNDNDSFDWRTYLTLGTHSITQINPDLVSPELSLKIFEFVDRAVVKNLRFIKGQRHKISNAAGKDPIILTRVQKVSALLILAAQISTKAVLRDVKGLLVKRIAEFFEVFVPDDTNSDYMAYASFAYIIAHQGLRLNVETSQKVLVMNQKLAATIAVLENENDSRTSRFEIRGIVFRAMKVIMENGDIEVIKGCILGQISADEEVKAVFPLVEIGATRHVNLLSGDSFVNGFRLVGLQASELENLFNLCKYSPGSLKFSSSKIQIRKRVKMVTLEVNPLTTKAIKKPNGKHITLLRIKIHDHDGSAALAEEYDDGSLYFYFTIRKKEWRNISVPATDDSKKPYSIYQLFDGRPQQEFLFQHRDISIWYSAEKTFTFDESLKNLIPVLLDEESRGNLANPLAPTDNMPIFESSEGSLSPFKYYSLFKYYSDHSGQPLWIRQDQKTLKWHLHFDSKYQLAQDQTFVNSEYLQNFLVVETSDGSTRKVLVPVEHYQIEKKKKKIAHEDDYEYLHSSMSSGSSGSDKSKSAYKLEFSRKNLDVLKSTILMSMTSTGQLKPSSRYEHLLLAYKYLVGREYLEAFNHLLKVHQIEPFSPSELRLFGWIMVSFTAMRDGSPESVAVRTYAAYLVFANDQLFGVLSTSEDKEEDEDRAPGPYDDEEKWMEFWGKSVAGEPCFKAAEGYFNIRAKIPVSLRFDFKSGRDLITEFEEKTWLEALIEGSKGLSGSFIAGHLMPHEEHDSVDSPIEVSQIAPVDITESVFNYKGAFAYRKMDYNVSSFHPENFESRIYRLFNHFMFGEYSKYELADYKEHLLSLKNSKFANLAGMLLSALEQRKSEKIPPSCDKLKAECSEAPEYSSWNRESWRLKCIKIYQECFNDTGKKSRLVPIELKKSTFKIPKIENENKPRKATLDGPLITPDIKAEVVGDYANLNELKEALLKGKISGADAIEILSKVFVARDKNLRITLDEIQLSINMAWEKETKIPLEIDIRRIAKGTISINEQDILHLYAKASKKVYHQYYPDVPEESYQKIHELCTKYVVSLAEINDIKRLTKVIGKREEDRAGWLLEVKKRRCRASSTDNVILAYEIFINSRLSKRQYNDIKELTRKFGQKYVNKVIQRMMSAGKTFILGTVLSNMKADKENLSVLVVPRALYSSEASSLISRTYNAFGTAGFSFRFSRESSKKTTKRLQWISEAMETSRKQGKYMIVAPELLLTLQNRFTEIVLIESRNEKAQEEFVHLQKILKLLHDHGAATFDEIDMIFDPTQELNFPLNSTRHDSGNEIKYLGTMLSELYYTLLDEDIVQIADIRKNIVVQPEIYEKIRVMLISKMVDKLSIKNIILPFRKESEEQPVLILNPENLHDKLNEFFHASVVSSDKDKPLERHAGVILDELSKDELTRSILSMLRLAINEWVLASWTGNVNENYGISSRAHYAIPYASAGVAKDGSEFSFRWLTYVRTQRMYLVLGFDRARLSDAIQWLQDWAMEDVEKTIIPEDSMAVRLSQALFEKDPSAIDIRSNEEMDVNLGKLKIKQDSKEYLMFLLMWTGHKVIPSVRFYESQISANAQDFSMLFNSIQGYTGTIASVKILPSVFHPKGAIEVQQKIENRIESKIRADKVHETVTLPEGWEVLTVPVGLTAVKLWELEDVRVSIASMEQAGHPLNAVLDVGAYFKDELNEAVAESMLKLKPSVLFFSTKLNKLALKTDNDKEKMIENISRASLEDLGIDDKDRITLYDQQHCTGVDIFQHDRGFALVILGLKTTTRDFNQAVMRMRKYLQGQKIVILVPDNVANAVKSSGICIKVDDVIAFLQKNMRDKVKMQNSLAMGHILRNHYKKPVYELLLSEPLENIHYCKAYNIWVKSTETPLEQQIIPLESRPFSDYMGSLIDSHEQSVSDCFGSHQMDEIRQEAIRIIGEATKDSPNDYPEEIAVSAVEDNDQMIENEVESNRQMDLENEMETQALISPLRGDSALLDFKAPEFPTSKGWTTEKEPSLIRLKTLLEDDLGLRIMQNFITTEIYISTAFMKHLFGRNRSYAFYILWLQKEGEAPRAAIINSTEAQIAKKRLWNFGEVFGYKAWVLTSSGIQCQLCSTAPDIDQKTIAEILIFSGLTRILESSEWLPYFETWLGSGKLSQIKSVIYRNIVLDESEGRKALKGPLGNLLKVDEDFEKHLVNTFEYQLLNVLTSNTKKSQKYLESLINQNDPQSFNLAVRFSGYSVSLGQNAFYSQAKACIRKGIDLLVTYVTKTDEQFMPMENWTPFESLAPFMDNDDYIYVLQKMKELNHFDDCENKALFGVLSTFLTEIKTKFRAHSYELRLLMENMENNFLDPFYSYEMAMADRYGY